MPDPIASAYAPKSQRMSRIVGHQLRVHDRHVVGGLSKRTFSRACRTATQSGPCGRSRIRTLVDDLPTLQDRLAVAH
jgi:hypothetical protein